jgi:hypothetical protein
MKLAFIILAHDDPANLFRLAGRLLVEEDMVVIHWDKKNSLNIQSQCPNWLDSKSLARLRFSRRVSVEWGQWSVVEATLACLEALEASGENFDYVVLLSGADYPIKSVSELKAFFAVGNDCEYIECVDPDVNPWVVQGLVKDRFLYHHWFNWRDNPTLFDRSLYWQKKLGLKRKPPSGLKPHLGSQWWALTWPTIKQVLKISKQNRIKRFFKTTWVPDEMYFQTLIASFIPVEKRKGSGVTFYHFTHQGKPLVFYNDHFEFLAKQDYFFVRKLSAHASRLRDSLDNLVEKSSGSARVITTTTGHLDAYQYFISVQWRGIPGRRVIGRQMDPWYGDLEWNQTPYFVILSYPEANLEPLRAALNALPGVCCYGELFHGAHIDYSLSDKEHPFYPADKPALRDMKRPNFLSDLIRVNPDQLLGFTLRLPSGNEMDKIVIFDRKATPVFVLPEDHYFTAGSTRLDWNCAFNNMIMNDYLAEARQTGRSFLILKTSDHILSEASLKHLSAYICSLRSGVPMPGAGLTQPDNAL